MVTDSCRMGGRRCPSRGAVLVCNGDMVAGEALTNGKSMGKHSWRRVMMNDCKWTFLVMQLLMVYT